MQPQTLDMSNLELLFHYTTVASLTLSSPRRVAIWQVNVPQMAISNKFLMHGILAVSALHLASLQPVRSAELVLRATMLEQMALSTYRQNISVQDSSNIHAALVFTAFIVPYVLALSVYDNSAAKLPTLNDSNPHWFFLVRGTLKLVHHTWPAFKSSPLGPLVVSREEHVDSGANFGEDHLAKLYDMLDDISSDSDEQQVVVVCKDALENLRRVFGIPYMLPQTLDLRSTVYIWPGTVSQEYINLIHERRSEALVILAHYCVILKKNHDCWFLKDVGKKMLASIEEALSPEWQSWIKWPLEFPPQ